MSAVCTEWARRHHRVRLADPTRRPEPFTVERARRGDPAPVDEAITSGTALGVALAEAWLRAAGWPLSA